MKRVLVAIVITCGMLLSGELGWCQGNAPEFQLSWSVTNPGSITIDSDGNVRVIIQAGTTSGISKYSPSGMFLGSFYPSVASTFFDLGSGGSFGGLVYTYERVDSYIGVESLDEPGPKQVHLTGRRTLENRLSYIAAAIGVSGVPFLAEANLNVPFVRRLFSPFQNDAYNDYYIGKDSGCHGTGTGYWADIAVGPDGTGYALWSSSALTGTPDHVFHFSWAGQPTDDGQCLASWGPTGSEAGQLSMPSGIDVGPDGTVYVADPGNHRVVAFDANGTFLTSWGSLGTGNGEFDTPVSVAVSADAVYVSDRVNNRIQKFGLPTPVVTSTWSSIKIRLMN